ncbi:hypothetical protein GCM10027189_07100 [Rufibacter soli]
MVSFATLAQTKKIPSPQPKTTAEAKAVEQAVVTFFDAMRTSDSTLARSVLAPNARLISVAANKEGTVLPRETPIQKFVEMIGQKHPQVLDERIWDVKVSIDGDLATLWCQYAFYVGDTFIHCGVDAFQLYRSPTGWKIFSIADTRRKENCDLQAAQAAKAK